MFMEKGKVGVVKLGLCVGGVVDYQLFDWFVFNQMVLDDFVDVFFVDEGVLDGFGVDYYDGVEFVVVQVVGFVDVYVVFVVDVEFFVVFFGVFLYGFGVKVCVVV